MRRIPAAGRSITHVAMNTFTRRLPAIGEMGSM